MMGSRACVGFLGTLLLVSGHLAAGNPIPDDAQKAWRFNEVLKYTKDPRVGTCYSFAFDDVDNNDEFTYYERSSDGPRKQMTGKIVSPVKEGDDWFCVAYQLRPVDGGSFGETKYVWMSNLENGGHAARASDCSGDAPLDMYLSQRENALCGEIPNFFQNGQGFRFDYDPDDESNPNSCFSFNFGGSLNPSDTVPSVCENAWGKRDCWDEEVEIEKISSNMPGTSEEWTCVALHFPATATATSEFWELWLHQEDSDTGEALIKTNTDDQFNALCELNNFPNGAPNAVFAQETCPSLPPFNSVKRYTDDNNICHSFDITTEPFISEQNQNSQFQYCRDRGDDTWAPSEAFCYPATTKKIILESGVYCVEFEWYYQETKALVITDSSHAKVVSTDGADPCDGISSNTNSLDDGRCQGLPNKLQDTIQFQDFDGRCHSFDFSNGPPAGGKSYSEFGYCNGGPLNTDPEYDNDRNCAGKAAIWTIQKKQMSGEKNWYCINFNVTSITTPGQHLWIDENGDNAVLSSDCQALPVLDFRRSTVTNDGMCHALPSSLRKQWRFWDRAVDDGYPVCNSFDFSDPLVEEDQAEGVFEGYDEFVYCRGIGGQRNCTPPRHSDEDDMNYARVTAFNHDDTNGWSCVEFSSPENSGALWLSDEGINMPGVFKSGVTCSSNRPSNMTEWSALEYGECPIMPENTRRENQVLQGVGHSGQSGSCASLDLTGHPGYDDDNQDMFEFCTGNGHCNNAKLFNLSDSGGMTCLSFSYETAYGLPDKHRSFVMSEDGGSAKLTASCKNIDSSDLADVTHRMCERLPGELQKGFFFLQDGTRATLELSHNPNEQDTSFVFCGNYRSANEVCRCAQLKHVINPDQGDKNWYCMTFEFDSAYGIDEDQHLWLNPHHYGWNEGAAQFKKDCSGTPPSPSPTPDVQGEFKVRDTANIPNVCPTATPSPSPGGGSSSSLSDSPGGIAGAVVGSLAGLGLLIGGGIFAKKKLGGKTSAREEVVSNEMPSAVTAGNPAAEGQAENAYTQRRSVDNPVRNIPSE